MEPGDDRQPQVDACEFVLAGNPNGPAWRQPQRGALTAVLSHWDLEDPEAALVSMPTGSGKTGVALGLRHLARSKRTLVVVPSQDLRTQLAAEFRDERLIRSIGALRSGPNPEVHEHVGRNPDWNELRRFDVIVAIPSSISPAVLHGDPPPVDMFDLVLVDEAHHAPAQTWKAILDHFSSAKAVLLTATPRRRDGKLVPGRHVFHYPLRLALKNNIYKPVHPVVLDLAPLSSADERDAVITREVTALAGQSEHQTSAILIRASTIDRAIDLAAAYSKAGLECAAVHNRMGPTKRKDLISRWRAGSPRALAVVDMLGEGIDVPNLRIVGYHDKHKSTTATIQLLGRLARSNDEFSQDSVLVTARDQDVFPALRGTLRSLYEEDADWVKILPDLIDADLEEDRAREEYASQFDSGPATVSVGNLRPLARVTVLESTERGYAPAFVDAQVPESLTVGKLLRGQEILYSGTDEARTMLVIVTAAPSLPRWYSDDSLRQVSFDLHVFSWHSSNSTAIPDLLLVNSADSHIARQVRGELDPDSCLRGGRPEAIQSAFESIERLSVSNVGVRNTHRAGSGTTAYATFAGSGVDRGMREADTDGRGLGHAMAQVYRNGTTVNAGFSAAKAKYWETRYIPLLDYREFIADFTHKYWSPEMAAAGALLPDVARPHRTESFTSDALIAELSPNLIGEQWATADGTAIDDLDLEVIESDSDTIELHAVNRQTGEVLWRGLQHFTGKFETLEAVVAVHRGFGREIGLEVLLEDSPPSIYLADGSMVFGAVTYDAPTPGTFLPPITYTPWDWSNVDTSTESKRIGKDDTIHDQIERNLAATSAPERWIVCNDGGGEIADHIVIERNQLGRIRLELWHAKASSGSKPGARVKDMQVVAAQALKSRRHLTDKGFWARLGRRLDGTEQPPAIVISGNPEDLRAVCGLVPERIEESIHNRPPLVDGHIVVVQPGLSFRTLRTRLDEDPVDTSAGQVREFLTALHNGASRQTTIEIIGSI